MVLSVYTQLFYFLSTVIAGITVGIMFDIYRVILGFNSPNRLLTAIADLLFWILCSLTVFVFFLYTNNGDLRYYTFVGLGLGMLLYFKLVSRRVLIAIRSILYFIAKIVRIMLIFIIYPIKYIVYLLKYIIYKLRKLVKANRKPAA